MKPVRFLFIILMIIGGCATDLANPPITPRWAFSHIVWEDSLNNTKGATEIVDAYLSRNIPVGAVIIDSPWSTAYNDFNWDLERYGNPQAMIEYFKGKNVKVMLWLTGVLNHKGKDTRLDKCEQYDYAVSKNYGINESQPGHWWKGDGIHIDFTNPEAVEWWNSQLDKVFVDGVYGWKVDQGEYWFGDTIKTYKGKMSNAEFRPYYYDAMYDYTVSHRPEGIIMARPYSHQGGYAASVDKLNLGWSGDFSGDWNGLKNQIDNIYQSAEKGYGSPACEVAGFYQKRAGKEEFVRYAQFGCMTATMVNGGENGAFSNHLPWYHGNDVTEIYRECVTLHESLIPYLFSSSVDNHNFGGSLLKDLNFQEESHCLGRNIFTKAITSAGGNVKFTLPENSDWIDLWSNEQHSGGASIEREYPLSEFPVFIRKGAIIPIRKYGDNKIIDNMGVKASSKTTIVIYPDGKSFETLHLPTGDGIEYVTCQIVYDEDGGVLRMTSEKPMDFDIVIHDVKTKLHKVIGATQWVQDYKSNCVRLSVEGTEADVKLVRK